MTTNSFPNLTVLDHPLAKHKMSLLRDANTGTHLFRTLVAELAHMVAYEATRDLQLADYELETPLERMTGDSISGHEPVLVPILRAGLGMVEGVHKLVPNALVGHIGLERNHDTLEPREYYCKIPPTDDSGDRVFMILDPMLATGGSATQAVDALKRGGAKQIKLLCLVAAPEGVGRMLQAHGEVDVYAAALDRKLNDKGYILPGLGDAGDRIFGTL